MDIVVLLFIVLFALAAVIIAIVIINMRKRRRETEKGQRRKAEQEAKQRAEQKIRQQLEEKLRKADEERKRLENEAQQKAKEEEQKRLAAELQKAEGERHKAEEERKHLDEEARRKAEVQRQMEELRNTEEERRKAEEEHKRLEEEARCKEEETRRKAEEEARQRAKEEKNSRQIPPVHRPPRRPPRPQEPSEKRPPQETKQRRPKPEIVCWKRERQWMVGVEVPEELLGNSGLVVLQNASPLAQDEYREGCWRLEQAFGEMVVHWNEDEDTKESKVSLSEENYLLFKLTGRNQNQGRRVKSPSSGSYLVVVPEAWERDEALSGPPPVAPELVSLAGYKAHFFDLERTGDRKIAFRSAEGESFVIESKAPRFELVGTRVNDATEHMGPLFGERPPKIRTVSAQMWSDVETIVVGEEGVGKGRWRLAFHPVQHLIEQDPPCEVTNRKGGWYFLRLYDANDDLVESLDFRFIGGLKGIKVYQPSPLPSEAGHTTVSVELFHKPDCYIQPAGGLEGGVLIKHEDDKTILTIPPDPTRDETCWLVGPQDEPQVEVTILVERLWWAVGDEDDAPPEWEDQLLTLAHDDLAATSGKALWLRLPKQRWTDEVLVGFDQSRADRCAIQVTRRDVAKPLRDFVTFKEITDREHEHLLKVWIEQADGLVEGVIAIIPAKRALLNPSMISAPRLATVLTSLRKVTSGPLLVLIKEARKAYPIAHAARRAGSVEFAKNALCVIALALELRGEEQSRILSLKKHWRIKAGIARDEFPEIMNRVRKRYKDVDASGARRAGNMYDKRYAE